MYVNGIIPPGIRVKMITGDHLNIAKETARLIGMRTNILKVPLPVVLSIVIV